MERTHTEKLMAENVEKAKDTVRRLTGDSWITWHNGPFGSYWAGFDTFVVIINADGTIQNQTA